GFPRFARSGRDATRTLARGARATSRARGRADHTSVGRFVGHGACPSLRTAARQSAYADDCIHRGRRVVGKGCEEVSGARSFPLTRRLLRDDSRRTIGPNSARTSPRGLGNLAFTEAWERFSYYGMQSLLVLYMVNRLLHPGHIECIAGFGPFRHLLEGIYRGPLSVQALASAIFGLYTGLVYLTPI